MEILEILDYSLLDLVAVVSTDSKAPQPNTFTFSFTQEDVAVAAIKLGIIKQPWDMDGGGKGQAFRIGYQMAGEKGNPQYHGYKELVGWLSGKDREKIVLKLFEAYKKELEEIALENAIIESLL